MDTKFQNTFCYKVIYVMTIADKKHEGLLKIGDATLHTDKSIDKLPPNCHDLNQAAHERIRSYTNTAGVSYKLLYTELARKRVIKNGDEVYVSFRDHNIHDILENSCIMHKKIDDTTGREWYPIDLDTAIEAISAFKNNYANLSHTSHVATMPIIFRPEQLDAIDRTITQFKKSDRMLWNAKMRFGKTLCALEVIKCCKFEKTIILTHRPVVNDGWYEDFTKIFTEGNYNYGSKANGYTVSDLLKKKTSFVYFASIQDLRGSSTVGGKFDKNTDIFDTVWDCVIVDEAHEGTTTSLGDETIKAIVKEEQKKTKFLALSGTPFNIMDSYDDKAIYTWDYIMEQRAKAEWDKHHFGDSNPYDDLPSLQIYTYNLGDLLNETEYNSFEDSAFNFMEFFRTWTSDIRIDHAPMPESANAGDFVHEQDIISFLNLMTATSDNAYPYSNDEYRNYFKHSLWIVPGVREAKALKALMEKHPVFGCGQFDIVNVAGSDDEESADALNSVKTAIANAEKNGRYTITLSCGKLTTGVTIKEWTAVCMLAGSYSTSAANYLQTIFRVQSPCNKNGMIKETAYVFDFAPDRTLKMVSEAVSVSSKAGKNKEGDKKVLGDFLNFCPVIAISGSIMTEYKADRLLQELKKAYADKVARNGFDDTRLYNDELLKLTDVEIEKFKDLKKILGKSANALPAKNINVNDQGLTDEEYGEEEGLKKKPKKELTEEEKARLAELKKKKEGRAKAISILRGISVRMPLLIFGADVPYDEEITLDKFVEQVDDSSWNEFMPLGVTKEVFAGFKKYYDEDIFISAGRRIRDIAREADTLAPTERVQKIASIFATFKNPDKETVLTPWRVVNMHMALSLGGYDFFDDEHKNELEEPRLVDNGQITKDTFANENVQILEINSKTGLYPLYVTYSIFRFKLEGYNNSDISADLEKKLWNDVVSNNVFIICKTPMAKQITQRTLLGYSNVKINAHCYDDLINQMRNKPQQLIDHVLRSSYWKKEGNKTMKFSACVGNPPYQEEGNSTRKAPIYPYFYDTAFKLSDIVSLITPGRFLFRAGQTQKEWNEKMLSNEHFKVVKYFSDSRSVFDSVDIKGGVVISLFNRNENYGEIGVFTPQEELDSILQKVSSFTEPSFSELVSSQGIYRFLNSTLEQYPEILRKSGKGTGNKIISKIIDQIPSVFTDKADPNKKCISIFGKVTSGRIVKYIARDLIENNEYIDTYNVLVPESNGTGAYDVFSTPVIAQPGLGFTDTFLGIGCFQNEAEAKSVLKYVKTKFLRTLVGIKKATQHNPKSVWEYVPMQDFTKSSDIDWSKSIDNIDNQLFAKYHLTEEEVKFIEEQVKPMK